MGNRFVLGENTYTTKALGGGRFDVVDRKNTRVGSFAIRSGVVEVEDEGVDGAKPVVVVATKWVAENLSTPLPVRDPNAAIASEPIADAPTAIEVPAPPVMAQAPPDPAPPASPSSPGLTEPAQAICRMGLHKPPDGQALGKARRHMDWLRTQPGVLSAHLTQDPATGKVLSIVVYVSREAFANMRYAKPPADAAPLDPIKVEQTLIVG